MLLKILCGLIFCFDILFAASMVEQNLDYNDSKRSLSNPGRGFYRPQVFHVKRANNTPIENFYGRFLHLRAELSEFSSNAWWNAPDTVFGNSTPLTEDALNAIDKTFENMEQKGVSVIVRFCYDPWYNGHKNTTPDQQTVLTHIEQLAPILSKHQNVIIAFELGLYGAYGEMHSDTILSGKKGYENVKEAVNYLFSLTPESFTILTRTPRYAAYALGFTDYGKTFNVDSLAFKQIAEAKKDTIYRLGLFNDGYLGTEYDYGTFDADCNTGICREEGVAWLETFGINTPYGGEALTTAPGYDTINTPDFLAYEGFRTHTSYLNIEWNNKLIEHWKNGTLFYARKSNPVDSIYNGLSGFKYIDDHLGYRFVLKKALLPDTLERQSIFKAKIQIQNTGFGNLTKKKVTTLILKKMVADSAIHEIPLKKEMDFRKVYHRKMNADTTYSFDGLNDLEIEALLPEKVTEGVYAVYLRISESGNYLLDNNYAVIQFANDSLYFDKETGSNFIGSFFVSENISGLRKIPGNAFSMKQEGNVLLLNGALQADFFDCNGNHLAKKILDKETQIFLDFLPQKSLFVLVKTRTGEQKIMKISKAF